MCLLTQTSIINLSFCWWGESKENRMSILLESSPNSPQAIMSAKSDMIQALGAIAWTNKNLKKRAYGMPTRDFMRDPTAVKDLCRVAGLDSKHLETLGLEAQARGCFDQNSEKRLQLIPELPAAPVLRSLSATWSLIDGTVAVDADDTRERYTVGPAWSLNSCAVDCTIYCAVMLDAGRIQVDQIAPVLQGKLSLPALVLRHVVSTAWGNLMQGERDELRNVLERELNEFDPIKFPLHRFRSINSVLSECLDRLPQLSYSSLRATRCCDGDVVVTADQFSHTTRRTGIQVGFNSTSTAAAVINTIYEWKPGADGVPCSRGDSCKGGRQRCQVILDRLPPILLLHLPEAVDHEENQTWKLFDDQHIVYEDLRGTQTRCYKPIGCVFMIKGDHFIVRWLEQNQEAEQILEYDGMKCSKTTLVKDWWDGLPSQRLRGNKSAAGVSAMFYRQATLGCDKDNGLKKE